MNRFYVEKTHIAKEIITIDDADDVRHLVFALRVQKGEEIFISDGEGASYIATVDQSPKSAVILKIKQVLERQKREDRKMKITVACAIPKFTRFEDIVDKGTQLGADEIIPLLTERTLVKKGSFDKKMGRLKRVMKAAAKQSGVLFLPNLKESVSFTGLMKDICRYELRLLPNLSRKSLSLKDAVSSFKGSKILVLIGPEGDFTPGEIDTALDAGCLGISLGDSVLRVDAAAMAVMSFLRLYFGL